jgi:hypothetical protein
LKDCFDVIFIFLRVIFILLKRAVNFKFYTLINFFLKKEFKSIPLICELSQKLHRNPPLSAKSLARTRLTEKKKKEKRKKKKEKRKKKKSPRQGLEKRRKVKKKYILKLKAKQNKSIYQYPPLSLFFHDLFPIIK